MSQLISPATRRRLDVQGMCDVSDAEIAAITPWHRMSFALCGVIAGVGTALSSTTIIYGLVPIAALAAAFPIHPFDLIYNLVVRHLRKTGPLPKRAAPVRFACAVGGAWLLMIGFCFDHGFTMAAYALGGVLVCMSALVTFADICIASYIYNALTGGRKVSAA